ncbi:hypothetical protein [Ostreiculturibacter nitratireducens]
MRERIRKLARDGKLSAAAHWTVFAIGLLSLTFSIGATAASAF